METEKRLIDADKVAQDVRENNRENFTRQDWSSKQVCMLLENAPTVDAVEVVRCKDCYFWHRHTKVNREYGSCFNYGTTKREDGFCDKAMPFNQNICDRCFSGSYRSCDGCSYGERRTDV